MVVEAPAPASKKAGSEEPIEPGLANDRCIITTTVKELEPPFGSNFGQRKPGLSRRKSYRGVAPARKKRGTGLTTESLGRYSEAGPTIAKGYERQGAYE